MNTEKTLSDTISVLSFKCDQMFEHPPFQSDRLSRFYYQKEYDKFKDQSFYHVSVRLVEGLHMQFMSFHAGKEVKTPSKIILRFVSQSSDWRFLRNSHLVFLLDGESMDLGEMERDGSVGNGYVLEFLTTGLDVPQFLKLISAEVVEGQLFTQEFKLSRAQLEAFRDFACKIIPHD